MAGLADIPLSTPTTQDVPATESAPQQPVPRLPAWTPRQQAPSQPPPTTVEPAEEAKPRFVNNPFSNAIDDLTGFAKGIFGLAKMGAWDYPTGVIKAAMRGVQGDNLWNSFKEETGFSPAVHAPLFFPMEGWNMAKDLLSGKGVGDVLDDHLGWRMGGMLKGMASSIAEYRDPFAKAWNHPVDVLLDSTVVIPVIGTAVQAARSAKIAGMMSEAVEGLKIAAEGKSAILKALQEGKVGDAVGAARAIDPDAGTQLYGAFRQAAEATKDLGDWSKALRAYPGPALNWLKTKGLEPVERGGWLRAIPGVEKYIDDWAIAPETFQTAAAHADGDIARNIKMRDFEQFSQQLFGGLSDDEMRNLGQAIFQEVSPTGRSLTTMVPHEMRTAEMMGSVADEAKGFVSPAVRERLSLWWRWLSDAEASLHERFGMPTEVLEASARRHFMAALLKKGARIPGWELGPEGIKVTDTIEAQKSWKKISEFSEPENVPELTPQEAKSIDNLRQRNMSPRAEPRPMTPIPSKAELGAQSDIAAITKRLRELDSPEFRNRVNAIDTEMAQIERRLDNTIPTGDDYEALGIRTPFAHETFEEHFLDQDVLRVMHDEDGNVRYLSSAEKSKLLDDIARYKDLKKESLRLAETEGEIRRYEEAWQGAATTKGEAQYSRLSKAGEPYPSSQLGTHVGQWEPTQGPLSMDEILMAHNSPVGTRYYPAFPNARTVSPASAAGLGKTGSIASGLRKLYQRFTGRSEMEPTSLALAIDAHNMRMTAMERLKTTFERYIERRSQGINPIVNVGDKLAEMRAAVQHGEVPEQSALADLDKLKPSPDWEFWSPDIGLNSLNTKKIVEERLLGALQRSGAERVGLEAMADAIRKSAGDIAGDLFKSNLERPINQLYAIPPSDAQFFRRMVDNRASYFGTVRTVFKHANDLLRVVALNWNPAHFLNRSVGDGVFALMSGASPWDYQLALKQNWKNYIGDDLAKTVSDAVEERWGKSPESMGIGQRIAEGIQPYFNQVDNFFRRHVALDFAQKEAMKGLLKKTGQSGFDALDPLVMLETRGLLADPQFLNKTVEQVNKFMGDYSHLHPIEQELFRGIFPFYAFMRHQNKLLFSQLGTKPAYLLNLSKTALSAVHDPNLPDYLDTSVPFGSDKEGNMYFLSLRGINPFMGFLDFGEDRVISAMNPILKAGVEYVSGKNFFTKKDIRQGEQIASYTGAHYTAQVQQDGSTKLVKTLEAESPLSALWNQVKPFQVRMLEMLLAPNVRQPDGSYKPSKWDENTAFTVAQGLAKGMGLSLQQFSPDAEMARRTRLRVGLVRDLTSRMISESDPQKREALIEMVKTVMQDGAIEGVANARK